MEAHRGGVRVLRVRVAVLGRLRASRLYADTLRGPPCPPRAPRDQAVRVVVRGDPGGVRDPALPHLRLAMGEAGTPAAVLAGEVRSRVDVRGTGVRAADAGRGRRDRKSTRLNSSHSQISYAVFCLTNKQVDLDGVQELAHAVTLATAGAPRELPLSGVEAAGVAPLREDAAPPSPQPCPPPNTHDLA